MTSGFTALSAIAGTTSMAVATEPRLAITQIRNATLRIDYAGVRFLVDPMLADRSAYPAFPGTPNAEMRNPLVHLPLPVDEVIDVDAVILTHLHLDHWDDAAR